MHEAVLDSAHKVHTFTIRIESGLIGCEYFIQQICIWGGSLWG